MGKQLFDQFTFLHFCVGAVVYYFGISFKSWFLLHLLFEIVENTPAGRNIINTYIKVWPGGKPSSDSMRNVMGDCIAAALGWLAAYYLNKLGAMHGWYDLHLV